jgi:succinate dehydrogenase flavin-adding protein (antitoxin of CptAB toxin-antitoxin module)
MTPAEQHRLRWKCRRGLLELDLVLERFIPTLKDDESASFAALLDLPDTDLWEIVAGRSNAYDARLSHIVERLRSA